MCLCGGMVSLCSYFRCLYKKHGVGSYPLTNLLWKDYQIKQLAAIFWATHLRKGVLKQREPVRIIWVMRLWEAPSLSGVIKQGEKSLEAIGGGADGLWTLQLRLRWRWGWTTSERQIRNAINLGKGDVRIAGLWTEAKRSLLDKYSDAEFDTVGKEKWWWERSSRNSLTWIKTEQVNTPFLLNFCLNFALMFGPWTAVSGEKERM